jgi:hypothetical protein
MPTGRCGFWLMLTAFAAATLCVNAMTAEPFETLANSVSKPVALGVGRVTVTLVPPASAQSQTLSARVATVRADRKVYLMVRGLGTDEPPETIYQLYLGLPPDVAPNPDDIYYVGSLNFFNTVNHDAAVAGPDPRFLSFDVTELLKTLQSRKSLGDDATVTIVPAGKPRAGAKAVIGEIALVEQ